MRTPTASLLRACLNVVLMVTAVTGGAAPDNERAPDPSRPCFPGAGYRKAVSSTDLWSGIEAVVTLPTPTFDPARMRPGSAKPSDSPSVYLGGRAGEQEVDCGLNWEVLREPDGSLSPAGKAYRIFWRARTWNSGPALPEYYFYPGDTVKMVCRSTTEPDKLRFNVQLLKRAAEPAVGAAENGAVTKGVWAPFDPVAAAEAQDEQWSTGSLAASVAAPISSFSVIFDAPGFGPGRAQEFKRVNGLDQSGNEGHPAQPTRTCITGAVWRQVHLLRGLAGAHRVPMTPTRFTDMRCPVPERVLVKPEGETGERVDLMGIGSGN